MKRGLRTTHIAAVQIDDEMMSGHGLHVFFFYRTAERGTCIPQVKCNQSFHFFPIVSDSSLLALVSSLTLAPIPDTDMPTRTYIIDSSPRPVAVKQTKGPLFLVQVRSL